MASDSLSQNIKKLNEDLKSDNGEHLALHTAKNTLTKNMKMGTQKFDKEDNSATPQ